MCTLFFCITFETCQHLTTDDSPDSSTSASKSKKQRSVSPNPKTKSTGSRTGAAGSKPRARVGFQEERAPQPGLAVAMVTHMLGTSQSQAIVLTFLHGQPELVETLRQSMVICVRDGNRNLW